MMNDTEYDDYEEELEEKLYLPSKVVYGIVIPLLVIVCIGGNILTIISYAQDRKLQTVHNTYLLSLASSDLLVGCVSMPFYAFYTLMDNTWPFGVAFCKIYMSIDFLACLESVFVIILVSYDRCMLVRQGAIYSVKQTLKASKIRIAVSWIVAFLIYVPAILSWDYIHGYSIIEEEDCDVEFYNNFTFTMITSVIEFFIPFTTIASLNLYLFLLIHKHSRNQTLAVTTQTTVGNTTGASSTDQRNRTIQSEKKAARSLVILVGVYAVCWTPYTVCTTLIAFCGDCVKLSLYEPFNWLLWANSSLNPFLYALMNDRFKSNFVRLLHIEKLCTRTLKKSKVEPRRELDETA